MFWRTSRLRASAARELRDTLGYPIYSEHRADTLNAVHSTKLRHDNLTVLTATICHWPVAGNEHPMPMRARNV